MHIRLSENLPLISLQLVHNDQRIDVENVLLDTGSAGTLFPTDTIAQIGLTLEPHDPIHRIRGVGGSEFVFTKKLDQLILDENLIANDFEIEVGAMEYGFDLGGIVGMDFLIQVGAIIDLQQLEIYA